MGQHSTARTLVDLLRSRAERYLDKVALSFSYHGDGEDQTQLTYRELDSAARAIASQLHQLGAAGQRVLVLCRPGLDCVAGFIGCLYAGAVAVPVHERLAPRLRWVVPDAQPDFALATPATPPEVQAAVDILAAERPLRWCTTDTGDAETWMAPQIGPDTIALVQYTSGSTRSPKGVVLTHANLLANLAAIHQAWPADEHDVGLFWLPPHHDMGLIGAVLEMLYIGGTSVLMSPTAFIKRPIRWLEAISRYRAAVTVAPNFAYDLCVEHSSPAERAALDLSSLSTAMSGAEPVRETTLTAFADAFAPAGFRPEAFLPVYGLAEATLLVSGRSDSARPVIAHIDRTALGEDRVADAAPDDPTAATVVGCGRPRGDQRVVIVDPETRTLRGPDEVGEIWIAGPSVAQGYWGRPEETEQTFSAVLADTGEGPFLRTGDLGFLRDDELFVTGRCKDLVIIRGDNYYPNDIEETVQGCHPALLSGRGAVFTAPPSEGAADQLVVVQETNRDRIGEAELTEIVDAIQAALTEHHGITAQSVILVAPMQIPTTSSGKIQRGLCKQQFLDRTLDTLAEWHAPARSDNGVTTEKLAAAIKIAGLVKLASALQQRAAGQG
jgi:acyl-CoA synthetase (AMP-forming)/AMP-acid ligase II